MILTNALPICRAGPALGTGAALGDLKGLFAYSEEEEQHHGGDQKAADGTEKKD